MSFIQEHKWLRQEETSPGILKNVYTTLVQFSNRCLVLNNISYLWGINLNSGSPEVREIQKQTVFQEQMKRAVITLHKSDWF